MNINQLKTIFRYLTHRGIYMRYKNDLRRFQEMRQTSVPGQEPLSPLIAVPRIQDFDAQHPIPQSVYEVSAASRYVATLRPRVVHDIGSDIHYLSVLSSFVPVVSFDVRRIPINKEGFESLTGDARRLPFSDGSIDFFTSLCVMEHIGLGRYGDPLDPEGDAQFASEIVRSLKIGGTLVLSVPIGIEVICFNAHRIYSKERILALFKGLHIQEESYIGPDGFAPHPNPPFGSYHIGVFLFTK